MSRENVELVKALFPPPGTDVCALFRDDATFAQVCEILGPHVTDDFQSLMVWPAVSRTYPGLDGLRRNWLDWLEPWATYQTNFDDVIDAGDSVLVLLRDRGRRKDMQTEVELIGATVLVFRDGKIARWEDYAERAAGVEAAGLAEGTPVRPG